MITITHNSQGDMDIAEDTELAGIVEGSVTVLPGSQLELRGMIIGELVLLRGSSAYIYGSLDGNIINQGGYVMVYGAVKGKIIEISGITKIDKSAQIDSGDPDVEAGAASQG